MKTQLPWLIIFFILFGIILYLVEFKPVQEPEIIIKEVVKWDTITNNDTIYQPKYHYSEVVKHDTIFDTLWMAIDYNTKYAYSDTAQNDSSALIVINDTIYQNRIYSRNPLIQVYNKTITRTIDQPMKMKWHLIAGGGVYGNLNSFGFDADIGIRTRKGTDYLIGCDPVNGYWRVGIVVIVK